jgi:hypothetical protein
MPLVQINYLSADYADYADEYKRFRASDHNQSPFDLGFGLICINLRHLRHLRIKAFGLDELSIRKLRR